MNLTDTRNIDDWLTIPYTSSITNWTAPEISITSPYGEIIEREVKKQVKKAMSEQADKLYNIISELLECDIRKEEFIKLLVEGEQDA